MHSSLRLRAWQTLGMTQPLAVDALAEAIDHEHGYIRTIALKALCDCGPRAARFAPKIVSRVCSGQSGWSDIEIPSRLAAIGGERLLPEFLQQLDTHERSRPAFRMMYSRITIRALATPESAKLLAGRLSDDDPEIRRLMINALRLMGKNAHPVLSDVKRAAQDDDFDVALNAGRLLLGVVASERSRSFNGITWTAGSSEWSGRQSPCRTSRTYQPRLPEHIVT